MKTLCYSVRLESLVRISDKAFRASAFDGSTAVIPASQIFGVDADVVNSSVYWISAWILEKKSLQYSQKKQAWFDDAGRMLPTYMVTRHVPEKVGAVKNNILEDLKR